MCGDEGCDAGAGRPVGPIIRTGSLGATGAVLCMHGPAATEQAVFLTTEATCATPEGIPYRALCDLVLYTPKVVVGGPPRLLAPRSSLATAA